MLIWHILFEYFNRNIYDQALAINWTFVSACRISGLPYNMKKQTSCYVGASCTALSCCTDDPEMETTFSWFIDVDFCHLKFSVGIENKKQDLFLPDFAFGTKMKHTSIQINEKKCIFQLLFASLLNIFLFCFLRRGKAI